MIFFGVGNHGGGPTIEQLNLIEELRNERDDVIYSSPEQFFENVDALSLPIIRDEMQPHAIGCYSAHSEIKQLHRKTENDLLRDERFAVLAALLGNTSQLEPLDRAWKNLCFNQFHDLLGGVAIQAACEDAISMYREAIAIAEKNTRHTVQRIAARIDTRDFIENIVVFNPSAFAREETIEFEIWNPDASERGELVQSAGLVASDGTLMPAQKIEPSGKIGEDRVRFASIVSVPALGWATFGIERNTKLDFPSDIKISSRQITNGLITFAHPAILNKGEDRNMATASEYVEYMPAILIEDDSDTWSHGLHAFNGKRKQFEIIEVQHIEEGPLRAGVRIVSKSGEARLEEEYFVSKGSPVIEVRVHIESFEKRKIIKLRFPHKCKNPVARYEIPYASIERPIGRNEWPGQSWVDVSERDGSRGLSLITDSKYSYSADEECIQVIAARSPLYAHHEPPHIVQTNERLRFLDQGVQEFRMLLVPHEGDWRTPDLQGYSEQLHQPLIAHTESSHAGNLPKIFSGFISVTPGIQIGAIKMTEMGDGIIVRAIESLGERATTSFQFPSRNIQWQSDFSPFEIKSFRIEGNIVTEVDLLERPL
jgi:alpha-mannosidase